MAPVRTLDPRRGDTINSTKEGRSLSGPRELEPSVLIRSFPIHLPLVEVSREFEESFETVCQDWSPVKGRLLELYRGTPVPGTDRPSDVIGTVGDRVPTLCRRDPEL